MRSIFIQIWIKALCLTGPSAMTASNCRPFQTGTASLPTYTSTTLCAVPTMASYARSLVRTFGQARVLVTARPTGRRLHTPGAQLLQSRPPQTRDRGPKSDEDTQTDFGALDVLRNTAAPATSIDACTSDGFALNNQMRVSGCGLLLLGGEAFRWQPWQQSGRLLNAKAQWEVPDSAWGVLALVYPKPGA